MRLSSRLGFAVAACAVLGSAMACMNADAKATSERATTRRVSTAAIRLAREEGASSRTQGCDTARLTTCYRDTARSADVDEDPMLSPRANWIWFAAAGDSLEISASPEAFVSTSIGQERDSLRNTARQFRRRLQSDGVVIVWLSFDEQTADSVPYTLRVRHEGAASRPLQTTGEVATLTVVSRRQNSTFSLVPASLASTVRDRSQWRIFARTYRVALVSDSLYELCRLPCSSPQMVKLTPFARVVVTL
jgi:hypothetical protein